MSPPSEELRIGHGYDLHRLEPCPPKGEGKPFVLAGVHFEHDLGPVGHSDGDSVLHAVTDALLGAIGAPDIGQLFPDTDPAHQNKDSMAFLKAASEVVDKAGMRVVNLDVTVVCERPRLSDRKDEMIANIALGIGIDSARVNLKGKTHEKVDAVGEGRAIEVHAVALLAPNNS